MSNNKSNPTHEDTFNRIDWSKANLTEAQKIELLRLSQEEEHKQRIAALGRAIIFYLTQTDTTKKEKEALEYVYWYYSSLEPLEG